MTERRLDAEPVPATPWPLRVSSAMLIGALTVGMVPAGGLAYAAEAFPKTQSANGSESPGDGRAAHAFAEGAIYSFAQDPFVVPYGVSIDAWINRDDVALLLNEEGDAIPASALASLFADSAPPLTYRGSAYPRPSANFSADLAWAKLTNGAADTVALPDFATLNISVAPIDRDPDNEIEADALPLAPAATVAALIASAPGGEGESRITGSAAQGDLRLWLGERETSSTSELNLGASDPASELTFSPTADLLANGQFSSPDAGRMITVPTDAANCYIKLDEDMTLIDSDDGSESKLLAGQLVRVPVAHDALAPRIENIDATNPDGSPLDLASAWIDSGTLTVTSGGVRISCRVSDPAPVSPGDESSGIDEKSLMLGATRADGTEARIACDSFENGTATFTLDLKSLGGKGIYRLDDMKVHARDHAGNAFALALSSSPLFSGTDVTGIEVIDEQAAENKPKAELVISGATADEDGVFYAEPSKTPAIGFRVTDKRFDELAKKGDWLASAPVRYTVNGETPVVLDPLSFTSLPGTHLHQSAPADTLKLSGEGRYEIAYRYTGAKKYILGFIPVGAFESSDAATIVVDRTAPQIAGASIVGGINEGREVAKPAGSAAGRYILIGGARTIELDVADLAGAGAPEGAGTAGIASVSVELGKRADLEGGTADVTTHEYSAKDAADGTVEIKLGEDGVYRLRETVITVKDKAGNTMRTTLADVLASSADGALRSFDTIVVDAASKPSSGIEVSKGTAIAKKGETPVHNASVTALYWISDEPWAKLYLATDDVRAGISALHAPAIAGDDTCTVDPDSFAYNPDASRWERRVELPAATAPDGAATGAIDGRYDLVFAYRDADVSDKTDNRASFIVDVTAPRMTDARLKDGFDPDRDVAVVGGSSVLVGGERTIRVRVQDLVPGAAGTADARDAAEAAGVGDASADASAGEGASSSKARIQVRRACAPSLEPDATAMELPALTCDVDAEGWAEIPLDSEGVYDLADIVIDARDAADNAVTTTLADYIASLPADQQAQWPARRILVDLPDGAADKRSATLSIVDAPGTPASEDPSGFYHRGAVVAEISVTDPWFEAYMGIPARQEGFFTATCTTDEGSAMPPESMPALDMSAFSYDEAASLWKARWELPRDPESADGSLPVQGRYELSIVYAGIAGATDATKARGSFGIDWTAPEFGRVELSSIEPMMWGWIFPRDGERITAQVADNLSGVNGSAVTLDRASSPTPFDTYQNGRAEMLLDGDAERVVFGDARLRAKDVAGNERTSDALSAYADSNVPEGAIGLSVDAKAPVMSVAYDNNDVRNGRYYNAPRVAAITIVEANFDLIRENDPKRVIAAATRGNEKTEFTAEQFEQVSVEGAPEGTVWQLRVPFEEDGDWTLDARFTDPAGREAASVSDSFTIDMTAPTLLVAFDNNRSENGMYFNKTRTATATVRERNFDPSLAHVAPTSSTGNAPAASPWANDGQDSWTSTVRFGQEGRFALSASCTDLAGNAAEVIEVPEFVIDMTAPTVSIGGVEDRSAYAGRVAPTIAYGDENFDGLFAIYELKGAAQGDVFMLDVAEEADATSKRVSFPDFEHTIERDDIYTLRATVHDLAGNEATQEVVFSVNRFGSNYILDAGSASIPGSYLAKPHDVVVHEINVSGLDEQGSHAEIVHDSRVRSLEVGADYTAEQTSGEHGWSDTAYTFPASLFEQDGYYRVRLTSRDAAGNLSQNTMDAKNKKRDGSADIAFAIDATAPSTVLTGVESNRAYMDPNKKAGIDARDNMMLDSATLAIDGRQAASWSADELTGYTEVPLEADGIPHTIALTTVDKAGNRSVQTFDNVVVTDDWLAYVKNTPSLLYGLMAGVIAAVAAAGLAAAGGVHRRRKKAALRNPFEK